MFSCVTRGSFSMYINRRLMFSLVTVAMSTTSRQSVNIHRSPEFTRLRLSRQKGQDCDLERLQTRINTTWFNQYSNYIFAADSSVNACIHTSYHTAVSRERCLKAQAMRLLNNWLFRALLGRNMQLKVDSNFVLVNFMQGTWPFFLKRKAGVLHD